MKTNAEIQRDIYEELKWDSRINEGDIGVSVDNGIVTLSGTIPTYAEKWAAEEATQKVAGVTAVVNKIDVKLASMHVRDDQDIARSALEALKWNVFVPQHGLKLMVEKAWITLGGKVDFDHQRKAAENAVRHLAGVRGVTNELIVEPPVSSKNVKLEIKRALHRHAEEEANSIQIEVNEDEVVLTGKVQSWEEKGAVESAALGTAGVRKVKNNVTIGYI